MRLTTKDKTFLETLRRMLDEGELSIEFREDGIKRIILRQNYGAKIHQHFGMSRQGVRWRFQRLFCQGYVETYERLFWFESLFGIRLRHYAIAMAKQRIELRKKARKLGLSAVYRRQNAEQSPGQGGSELSR